MTAINGTIQQVKAQLAISNPDWKFEVPENSATADFPVRFKEARYWCGEGHKDNDRHAYDAASVIRIEEGVDYLQGTGGAGVGAKSCARISCSYESAVRID